MPSAKESFNRNKLAIDYVINLFGTNCERVKQEAGFNLITPEGYKVRVCSVYPRVRKNSKTIRFTLTEKTMIESNYLAFVEMDREDKPIDCKIASISDVRAACKYTPLPDGKSFSMSIEYDKMKLMESVIHFRTKGQKVIYINEAGFDHTHAYIQVPGQDIEKVSRWTVGEFRCLICSKTRKLAIGMV
ncbi:MAG: hypothetical protein RDV48_11805 [Candidatus Eremiobacteraeota bacterium]|nr:hypothetical protein [Candidatus Eremiobacteraeota bacterium]